MIVEATKKIVENKNLTTDEAEQVMDEIMSAPTTCVEVRVGKG